MIGRAWLGNWLARRHWRKFAASEPYWAIETQPGNTLDRVDREAFYATGREVVAEHLAWARVHTSGLAGPVLDFGCGAGRLTLALRDHFERVTGVDAAPDMLALARAAGAGRPGVDYVLNERADLRALADDSQEFVYSHMVLQHLPPPTALRFLSELARLCRPGGHMLFQLPAEDQRIRPASRRERGRRAFWRPLNHWCVFHPAMEVHEVAPARIERVLRRRGCRVIARRPDLSAGPEHPGFLYLARKD